MPRSEEEIGKWVSERLKEGNRVSDIRLKLIEGRISGKDADEIIMKARMKRMILPASIILVVLLAMGAYFLFFRTTMPSSEVCIDPQCFIDAANLCKSASFNQIVEGSIYSYSIDNCVLTKTAVLLNESEPESIRVFLEGKSMTCSYASGGFDSQWVDSLSLGIENCTGDFKDGIEKLKVLFLPLE